MLKTLKICGSLWTVRESPCLIEEGDKYGCANFCRQEIVIQSDLPTDLARSVMAHEVLHVLWSHFALGESSEEERAITALANGLAVVLRENPKLVEYLTG